MTKEALEDKIIEPLTKLLKNHIYQSETIIRADNISINFWTMERDSLLKNEPPTFLKKKHSEWEIKLKDVNNHLEHLHHSKEKTLEDLYDLKS